MQLEKGVVIAGKYRLEQLLGQGGMGSVWSAHHLGLDKPVAVKFMAPALCESAISRARFEREAKAAAKLVTRHVVQIYDHGVEDDVPYMAMELLSGEDLADRLGRVGRMKLDEAREMLEQICKGLQRAHDAGIVHRDLKPANLFFATLDDEEVVKILDFGIAKALEAQAPVEEQTKTGQMLGSPHYMSPEQCGNSKEVDGRSDL